MQYAGELNLLSLILTLSLLAALIPIFRTEYQKNKWIVKVLKTQVLPYKWFLPLLCPWSFRATEIKALSTDVAVRIYKHSTNIRKISGLFKLTSKMFEPCIQMPFPQLKLIMQKVHLSNILNFSVTFFRFFVTLRFLKHLLMELFMWSQR